MKVGDLVKMDFSAADGRWSRSPWLELNGTLGVITDTDPEQGSVFVLSQNGVEEIHTCYLEVINESGRLGSL